MKTYQAVRAEIAKLEKQAEELRRQELRTIIAQVRQVIADYGLTAADLGLAGGRARAWRARRRAGPAAAAGVAKYRDPKSGQTWTGHGRPPAWIVGAKDRDAFLIDAPAPSRRRRRLAGQAREGGQGAKPAAGQDAQGCREEARREGRHARPQGSGARRRRRSRSSPACRAVASIALQKARRTRAIRSMDRQGGAAPSRRQGRARARRGRSGAAPGLRRDEARQRSVQVAVAVPADCCVTWKRCGTSSVRWCLARVIAT